MARSQLSELLGELVRIPSVSGDESVIAGFVLDRLRSWRLEATRTGNTVLAKIGAGGGPRLLLHSHLDTVPAGEGWTREPFADTWEGARCFGRGSNDAKGSVAAMLHAARRLAEAGALRPGNPRAGELWLAFTECEETNNRGMAAALASLGTPDGAVAGEPTGLQVVRAQAGLAVLEASWKGSACHAAHVAREKPANALLLASSDLAATAPYVPIGEPHELLGESRVVATVLRAGERHNCIPERAEAVLDARLAPPHTAADAAAALARRMPNATITIRSDRLRAVETPAGHPLVGAALRAAGRETAVGSPTMSDWALLPGVPAVKCGPGESHRSHVADEYLWESELEAGARFYEAFAPAALEALASASRAAAGAP